MLFTHFYLIDSFFFCVFLYVPILMLSSGAAPLLSVWMMMVCVCVSVCRGSSSASFHGTTPTVSRRAGSNRLELALHSRAVEFPWNTQLFLTKVSLSAPHNTETFPFIVPHEQSEIQQIYVSRRFFLFYFSFFITNSRFKQHLGNFFLFYVSTNNR